MVTLTGIPRADRKKAHAWITERIPTETQIQTEGTGRLGQENLCPHCYEAVEQFPSLCPHCQGRFKSGSRAGLLSLAFPGLGDWYLGHRGLAICEMLGAAAMWSIMVLGWLGSQEAGEAASLATMAGVAVVMIVFVHGLDAWVTRHTGHKGIYPAAD